MHSRSYMLLRRDFIALQREPLEGISAVPQEDQGIYQWNATITGLAGTEWEGGLLQLSLIFNEEYNTKPPGIHFVTIPFHPNVDPNDGSTMIHLLRDDWSEECTVGAILLALQSALSQPVMEDAYILNHEAARLFREAPHTYRQMAQDCTVASLRVDAGLSPYEFDEDQASPTGEMSKDNTHSLQPSSKPTSTQLHQKYVSYDEYLTFWKGIATSVTDYKQINQFVALLQKDKTLQKVHSASVLPGSKETIDSRVEQYIMLRYGNFKAGHGKNKHNTRLQRVEELKNMYQNAMKSGEHVEQHTQQEPYYSQAKLQEKQQQESERELDIEMSSAGNPAVRTSVEVDELVEWTKMLNDTDIGS